MRLRKIGKLYCTRNTIKKCFPEQCLLNQNEKLTDIQNMKLDQDFPIFLQLIKPCTYDVYGKNRQSYMSMINNIKKI